MNDIIRTKHNEIMRYGTVQAYNEDESTDKTLVVTTRIINYDNKSLLDIMCNGRVISIIDLQQAITRQD